MIRLVFSAMAFVILLVSAEFAHATKHRLPMAYIPYSINYWKDGSSTSGVNLRYDSTNIPSSSPRYYDGHRGIDFAMPYGSTVYLSATGTVFAKVSSCAPNGGYIGNSCGSYFGNYVAVKHPDNLVSIYAHLSSVTTAAVNSTVTCVSGPGGTSVGSSGNSGNSSGAHLHYELRINNLAAASMSYDPFGGSASTQSSHYWYDWALVPDTLKPGFNMPYPVTTCQP